MCNQQQQTVFAARLVPQDEVKAVLRKAVFAVHPDRGGSAEAAQALNAAKAAHEEAVDGFGYEAAVEVEMPGLLHFHRKCKGKGCPGCHNTGLKLS